jgi:uncharacterized membrane protein YtjA (UPF0391 family)
MSQMRDRFRMRPESRPHGMNSRRFFLPIHVEARSRALHERTIAMLHYAAVFFVIALIAALFGFTGIAAGAVQIAKILFVIFLILFAVSLVVGLLKS